MVLSLSSKVAITALSIPNNCTRASRQRRRTCVHASSAPEGSTNNSQGSSPPDLLLPSSSNTSASSIADQLQQQLSPSSSFSGDVQLPIRSPKRSQPLVSSFKLSSATVSQRRNYRRAVYLKEVSKRDDRGLFVGLFLLLVVPPAGILAVAFFTGYLEFLS